MRRFWRKERQLRGLEEELRELRSEAPATFIRTLVPRRRETHWRGRRLQVGLAVGIASLALAAMASAGGLGIVTQATTAVKHTLKRVTSTSKPLTLYDSSPSDKQYKKHCGDGGGEDKCHITISDDEAQEPSSGSKTTQFKVTLDTVNDVPVTVHYQTANGTAIAGACSANGTADYQATGGTLTFPTGSPTQMIPVTICADTPEQGKKQPAETYFMNLSSASSNAVIDRAQATGKIDQ